MVSAGGAGVVLASTGTVVVLSAALALPGSDAQSMRCSFQAQRPGAQRVVHSLEVVDRIRLAVRRACCSVSGG